MRLINMLHPKPREVVVTARLRRAIVQPKRRPDDTAGQIEARTLAPKPAPAGACAPVEA